MSPFEPAAADRGYLGPILVVDDDALFRQVVATILTRAGYATVEAATGEAAVDAAKRRRPEAVVLDVQLPGISGYEVCQQLGAHGDRPPVLFVSGARTESFDRVAGLLVGGDDYLLKPFAADELLARLNALIRRARRSAPPTLTAREREVVHLLRQGIGAEEVAARLGESTAAVRDRLDSALSKLGV